MRLRQRSALKDSTAGIKRYAIKDEAALDAAVKKYAAAAQDRQVLPLRKEAKG